jgi:hypothetical protein
MGEYECVNCNEMFSADEPSEDMDLCDECRKENKMKYLIFTYQDEYMTDEQDKKIYFSSLEDAYNELKTYFNETNMYALIDGNTVYNFNQFVSMSKIHDEEDLKEDYRNRHNYLPNLYNQYVSKGE